MSPSETSGAESDPTYQIVIFYPEPWTAAERGWRRIVRGRLARMALRR